MVSLHPHLRLILNSSIIFTISLVVTVLLYYISTMLLKLPLLLHTSDRMMHRIKKSTYIANKSATKQRERSCKNYQKRPKVKDKDEACNTDQFYLSIQHIRNIWEESLNEGYLMWSFILIINRCRNICPLWATSLPMYRVLY